MVTATAPTPNLNEDACWQAVLDKRADSDGIFFVAVRTTGVYCRPPCPSRTPKRENVRFFATADQAEAAGFRACKRCRPRDPARADVALVQRICRRLDAAEDGAPTLAALSEEFGVSPFHLQRTFKRVAGLTPRRYAASRRAERLRGRLRAGDGVVTAVYGAGYGSTSRAYEAADGALGMTPARYRRGGEGMRISYTIVPSTFGRLLVGATERGVCAVKFSDNDRALEQRLRDEYGAADIARDDAGMRRWVDAVLRAVDDGEPQPHLPLDIRATAFRARVWEALRTIPRGETRTYAEIARQVGVPGAARAVGNACHDNPVAVIIPCHRVVRGNGDLGGYGGGVDKKRRLLQREGALPAAVASRNGKRSRA